MKTAHRSFARAPFICVFLFFFYFLNPIMTHATVTPSLGLASTFGVLSDTFTSTGASSTISGDVGYTTTSGAYIVNSGTDYGSSAPYAQAGLDQATALSLLNAQTCTFTFFAGAVDLATDTTHGLIGVYTPGVYCITGAVSVGTGGIALSGVGTYIFRSSGALTTVDNSVVHSSGVSSCDVFWTPNGATTLGANTTFVGTVIPVSQDITIGTLTSWFGQALTFGHTVTIDTSSIHSTCSVGTDPVPTGILSVVKQVVNTGGGTALASDFQMHVKSAGSDVVGSPDAGMIAPGRAYTLIAPATYTVSEDANVLYTQSFSGDCDSSGVVSLVSSGTPTCTVMNTYIIPIVPPTPVFRNVGHPPFPVVVIPPVIVPLTLIPEVIVPVTQILPVDQTTIVAPASGAITPTQVPLFPNTGISPDESVTILGNDIISFLQEWIVVRPEVRSVSNEPNHMLIPLIHLDVSLESIGLTKSGALDVPKDFNNAGWFNLGPRPGEQGNAVIDGHYGWKNGVPAVFNLIHTLHTGDVIFVNDTKGKTVSFSVREIRTYDSVMDAHSVFVASDTSAHLVIITCSGVWVPSLSTYSNRLVIFADRTIASPY
ncbi:MAG: ice-binding family protein [bacterium]